VINRLIYTKLGPDTFLPVEIMVKVKSDGNMPELLYAGVEGIDSDRLHDCL
jgi:hypothetical protein